MAEVKVEKRRITPRAQTVKRERPKTREEQRIDALSPTISILVKAVRKAGRRLIRDFGEIGSLQISQKGTGDFVSNADIMAEKTLIEELSLARPDYGFITEESAQIAPQEGCDTFFVIDPIDGTTNFLHALPNFAICVAVMEGETITAGVTYNPVTNELYYAEKGKGAYLMTPTGNMRLRVSGRNKLLHSLVGSNGFSDVANRKAIEKVSNISMSVRYNGSTALGLACVSTGQYDAYIATRFKLWDIAVGYLLIRESGGFVGDFKGNIDIMSIVENQQILASNAALKSAFMGILKE